MFGLAHLVISAECDLRDNNLYARDEGRFHLGARLRSSKLFWLVATGVLALLVIGGNAA